MLTRDALHVKRAPCKSKRISIEFEKMEEKYLSMFLLHLYNSIGDQLVYFLKKLLELNK